MKKIFTFPDVGEGIAEGEIVAWLVRVGDFVKEDQPVIEVETDKAVVSLPSPYSGKVVSLKGETGQIIEVGTELFTIETTEETESKSESTAEKKPGKKKDAGSVVGVLKESEEEFVLPIHSTIKKTAPAVTDKEASHARIRAIPSVRARAKALGLDLLSLVGSGPEGRILREDVEQAATRKADAGPSEIRTHGPVERIPFRGVRRSGAKRVSESSAKVAAVTFVDDADITKLEKVRLNKKDLAEEKGFNLTYLPFIIKSLVAGLKAFPFLNATLDEAKEEIILKKYYNLGIAVDTPNGLMVFVIKHADQKSILDLAQEIAMLTEKAFSRKIALSELKGGTFTLSNYGVIGGIYGTPIINYPEVGILGLGKIEDRPVVRSGEIVIRKILPLSLTFDHRVIYGSEAARFMNTVIQHLEDPDLMLVEGK